MFLSILSSGTSCYPLSCCFANDLFFLVILMGLYLININQRSLVSFLRHGREYLGSFVSLVGDSAWKG